MVITKKINYKNRAYMWFQFKFKIKIDIDYLRSNNFLVVRIEL